MARSVEKEIPALLPWPPRPSVFLPFCQVCLPGKGNLFHCQHQHAALGDRSAHSFPVPLFIPFLCFEVMTKGLWTAVSLEHPFGRHVTGIRQQQESNVTKHRGPDLSLCPPWMTTVASDCRLHVWSLPILLLQFESESTTPCFQNPPRVPILQKQVQSPCYDSSKSSSSGSR